MYLKGNVIKLIKAHILKNAQEVEVWQADPYTAVKITFDSPMGKLVEIGFSKRIPKDTWDPDLGEIIAEGRALTLIAKRLCSSVESFTFYGDVDFVDVEDVLSGEVVYVHAPLTMQLNLMNGTSIHIPVLES